MFGKKSTPSQIASLIGAGSTIVGDVIFAAGLRIDGTVRGSVRCADGGKGGMLVISETGAVEGEVQASHVVVAGRISGPVHASELLELQPKAKIAGDVHYKALEMHHGAVVDGMLVHDDGATTTRSSPAPALKLAVAGTKSDPWQEAKPEPKVESAAG
jgi:cytoskeletal protein CcmA (bactofilin family)